MGWCVRVGSCGGRALVVIRRRGGGNWDSAGGRK